MMTTSGIRVLDDIKTPANLPKPEPEPSKAFTQKPNIIFTKNLIRDIF
jgi:hypothetical protein